MRAWLLILLVGLSMPESDARNIPSSSRAEQAAARVRADLETRLQALGARWGAPLYLRLFKQSDELEVWVASGAEYRLLHNWPICTWSGALGPKQRQGDLQAPEGFYQVGPAQLNPASRFHLAFNLGYPNAFDRAHQRTGDYLMVHGNCVSIGCYAMGDAAIEQIYTLVAAALAHGQSNVPVHIFPFRMPAGWQRDHAGHAWLDFWQQLEPAYQAFEAQRLPPRVRVNQGRYEVLSP